MFQDNELIDLSSGVVVALWFDRLASQLYFMFALEFTQ